MITVGAEEHDQGLVVLLNILLGQVGCAVQLQQVEGRDRGKTEIGRLRLGCIGGRLLSRLLGLNG